MSDRLAVGVDVGGTKMLVGVVDEDHRVLRRSTEHTAGRGAEEILSTLEREIHDARAAHPEVVAVGLGIPATINRERGLAINMVNLPLKDVPIRDLMSERIGLPISIDNDGNVAALAEHRFGAARGSRNAVVLTVGTGVGGGLILDDQVYRGSTGAGAELGHVVIDYNGPRCQGNCPNRGCVETMASGTALRREAREAAERNPDSAIGRVLAGGGEVDGRVVTEAALAGDSLAVELVATIGARLGVAMASLANIFEPGVIVIGGGVSAAGDLLVAPATEELRRRALPPQNETPVRLAELGPEAGMIGAATMALEEALGATAEGQA